MGGNTAGGGGGNWEEGRGVEERDGRIKIKPRFNLSLPWKF